MKKRIDLILVDKKIVLTRSKAQAMIMAGQIMVENKIVNKSGELHNTNVKVVVKNLGPQWVSRGSEKLIFAIKQFNIKIEDLTCLDIGASTGGFTEVLINYKAKKVFSVDVGTNQMHERLKKNNKIINIEKTNARYLDTNIINENINLIVCDVSFISLTKVLKPSLKFLSKSNGTIIALIKPQFEARIEEVKTGGIVTNSIVHHRVCEEIKNCFISECKLNVLGIVESPIKGAKGNVEFLIVAKN